MTGLRVHSIQLAAGITPTQNVLVIHPCRNGMRKACDSRITGACCVDRLDSRRHHAIAATIMEGHSTGSTHRDNHPRDASKALIGRKKPLELRHVIGRIVCAQKTTDLGKIGLDERGLHRSVQDSIERGSRRVNQHGNARSMRCLDELDVVICIDARRKASGDGHARCRAN